MATAARKVHAYTGLFKVLDKNGNSVHGGTYKWDLPTNKDAGDWTQAIRSVRMCGTGYHLTSSPMSWFAHDGRLFVAEGKGKHIEDDNKSCYGQVRLIEEVKADWPFFELVPDALTFLIAAKRYKLKNDIFAHKTFMRKLRLHSSSGVQGYVFDNSTFVYGDFSNKDLSNTSFRCAIIHNGNFSYGNAANANFTSARLHNAVFNSAVLTKAKFRSADLRGASFVSANITGVDFTDANLCGATFRGVGAHTGAIFTNAKIDATTDFSGINLNKVKGMSYASKSVINAFINDIGSAHHTIS